METTTTTDNLALYLNTTRPISNWTFDDLKKLNDAKAKALLPAMLVIGLYMVLGIVGNSLVCYVMGFKLKMNTQNMLIIYLAVFDLLNCLVCMPADIHDMQHYFYFPSEIGCKIVRMIMTFTGEASIFTLLLIAVDRYRKICKPLKSQLRLLHVKRLLLLTIFVATFISWPTVVVFGFRTIDTGIPGIQGHDCSLADSLKGTIYTSGLFLLYIVTCVCLIVLYSCILVAARRHMRFVSNPNHYTYPSTTGATFVKNTSTSVTTTTEETSSNSGLRQSHESLNECNSITQCQRHSKPHVQNTNGGRKPVTKTCGLLDIPEVVAEGNTLTQLKNIIEDTDSDTEETNQNAITTAMSDDPATLSSSSLHSCSTINALVVTDASDRRFNRQPRPMETNQIGDVASLTGQIQNNVVKESEGDRNIENVDGEISTKKGKHSPKISRRDHKTTIIAFLVTIVFILSYAPYLGLQISKQLVKGFDYDLQGAALVSHNIFLRFYYINSVANPIIYGILNNRFRGELRVLLSKLCQMCQRDNSDRI